VAGATAVGRLPIAPLWHRLPPQDCVCTLQLSLSMAEHLKIAFVIGLARSEPLWLSWLVHIVAPTIRRVQNCALVTAGTTVFTLAVTLTFIAELDQYSRLRRTCHATMTITDMVNQVTMRALIAGLGVELPVLLTSVLLDRRKHDTAA
jgi:Sec-independent protein secretion pathway component TatC